MRGEHLLIQKAFTYEADRSVKDPENCGYDDRLGAWMWKDTKEFLVKSNDPGRPRPVSKKMDQETGEDLKGA
jgi:hypothetical protein